jgi:hypothetical protein
MISNPPTYPIVALIQDFLCLVPVSILLGTLQICTVMTVQVLEDPVLIPQPAKVRAFRRRRRGILCRGKSPGLLWQSSRRAGGRWDDAGGEGGDGLGGRRVSRKHRGGWLCSNEQSVSWRLRTEVEIRDSFEGEAQVSDELNSRDWLNDSIATTVGDSTNINNLKRTSRQTQLELTLPTLG